VDVDLELHESMLWLMGGTAGYRSLKRQTADCRTGVCRVLGNEKYRRRREEWRKLTRDFVIYWLWNPEEQVAEHPHWSILADRCLESPLAGGFQGIAL